MEVTEILKILQQDIKAAVFSTVDAEGKPHARHANVGVANEQGIFFMTSPKTNFYAQMKANPHVAITGMHQSGYLIQVIRIEGKVKEIGKEKLEEVLKDNPFVQHVYPDDADRQTVQVFQMYQGKGTYQSLTQGHKYQFEIGLKDDKAQAQSI